MNVHISYQAGKTPDLEREFQYQLQKLQRRLHIFKPDLVKFHAIVEHENGRAAGASLSLRLPSGLMAVQKSGENTMAAVKSAFLELLSQVTRHKEVLRGHWTGKAARRSGREWAKQVPILARKEHPKAAEKRHAGGVEQASALRMDGSAVANVEAWLSANLHKLEEYIDQELRFQVEAERIREDQITREEVIDEVIVSALSQEDGRTQLLSPESWFHRLALQAIRRLIHDNADTGNISLDAPAGIQNVTGSDENVLQYHQPDDSLPEESVIRDQNVRTPEEIMAGDEMVAQLDLVLREVQPQDREAFVLFTLEGFTVEEIARLMDRQVEQIRQSVQHARTHIQQKLPSQNELRRSLLHHSRVA